MTLAEIADRILSKLSHQALVLPPLETQPAGPDAKWFSIVMYYPPDDETADRQYLDPAADCLATTLQEARARQCYVLGEAIGTDSVVAWDTDAGLSLRALTYDGGKFVRVDMLFDVAGQEGLDAHG